MFVSVAQSMLTTVCRVQTSRLGEIPGRPEKQKYLFAMYVTRSHMGISIHSMEVIVSIRFSALLIASSRFADRRAP